MYCKRYILYCKSKGTKPEETFKIDGESNYLWWKWTTGKWIEWRDLQNPPVSLDCLSKQNHKDFDIWLENNVNKELKSK